MNAATASMAAPLVWTEDLDQIAGYLTMINGIDGAGVFDVEGLPLGVGPGSQPKVLDRSTWYIEHFRRSDDFCARTEHLKPLTLVEFDDERFWFCAKILERFYYVVAGPKGSWDLFKGRIERCVQMTEQALKERRIAST